MPTPSFSKDITTIFNNNELKDELKYDIACRLVCETLGVASTSMLLYAAREDKLVCKGHYLGPSKRSLYTSESDDLQLIVENIVLFEFFSSDQYEKFETITREDFKRSSICGKTFQTYDLDVKTFSELHTKWTSKGFQKLYSKYKQSLHSEVYDVSEDSLSGQFFGELLEHGNTFTDRVKVADFAKAPKHGKPYFSVWQKLGIQLPENDLVYVGLPLYANERFIGILRLTVSKDSEFNTLGKKKLAKKIVKSIERLNNFSQLVSLHLKTDYYLAGYQTLSNLSLDFTEKLNLDPIKLQSTCDTLTTLINCHGCIMRFNDGKQKTIPPIRATSVSLNEYHEYIKSLPPMRAGFSEGIYLAFQRNKEIKAINFRIADLNTDTFNTKEYYYDEGGKLRVDLTKARRLYDYTPDLNRRLRDFKIVELLILPIDQIEDGVIVLTNTLNRSFTLSDVEIMLLATKRLQLEIKSRQETEHQRQNELQNAQLIGMNVVIHQFGQTIKSSSDVVNEIEERTATIISGLNMDDKSIPPNIVKTIFGIKLLGFLVMKSQSQIRMAERIMKIELEPVVPKIAPIHDFYTFLRQKCKDFAPYASVERQIHIWMMNQHREYFKIDTDRELLTEILNSLLDNAVKYSFEGPEMRQKGINYNPHDYRSDGHIKVEYFQSLSEIEIHITNWGYAILPNELESIFERSRRGTNSKHTVGTGIGLYLSKKFAAALPGDLRVEIQKNRSTFILTLKK